MWTFLFCLLPSLLLVLLSVLLQWNYMRCLAERAIPQMGSLLWTIICSLLKLPTVPESGKKTQAEVRIIGQHTTLAAYLKKHCHALRKPPLARWPHADPHLQIITNLFWPTSDEKEQGFRFSREHLLLQDGGIVALDWAVGLKDLHSRVGDSSSQAIVIVIPNSFGKVTPHLLGLCQQVLQNGFYAVVFHRRGHAGCPLATPHYQEFGDPSDLKQVVRFLRSHYSTLPLLAVSEGSGSGLLLSYLGESGSSSHVTAAACISPVFHGELWLEHKLPWLYHWMILIYRKLQINRYATALSSTMDVGKVLRCNSLRQMEELMFCGSDLEESSRASTKPNWTEYWERNEPLRDADDVAVPVLCLCSKDDPVLLPLTSVPETLFHNNPYFLMAVTEQGGHCGFVHAEKHGVLKSWSHSVTLEYFQAVASFFGVDEKKAFKHAPPSVNPRHSSSTLMSRRTRPAPPRKANVDSRRRQTSVSSDGSVFEGEQEEFTWNRSYTR